MDIRAPSGESLNLAGNTILALCGLSLVYYLFYFDPVGYVYFVTEDYWAEWATFVSYFMASCLLAWTLFRHRETRTPGLFLLALGTFLVAMEEISWGQRVLGIHPPTLFAERNLKAEMNVHNFFSEPFYVHLANAIAVFLWAILLPMLTRKWTLLRRWCDQLGIPIVPIPFWPFFLVAIYFHIYPSVMRSEVAEMYLAIAIAALSLDIALTASRDTRTRGASATGAIAGMIVIMGILTAFLVRFQPWPGELKRVLNKMAGLEFSAAGMYQQAEVLFDYMSRNPEFLLKDTHFEHGLLLKRMGRDAKAKGIFEMALAEQERLQQRDRTDPGPYRTAGQVLRELARPEEATRAFQDALRRDQARLEEANDPATKAWSQWSIGLTLLAMGNSEAGLKQLSAARSLAPDWKTRHQMSARIKWWRSKYPMAE